MRLPRVLKCVNRLLVMLSSLLLRGSISISGCRMNHNVSRRTRIGGNLKETGIYLERDDFELI